MEENFELLEKFIIKGLIYDKHYALGVIKTFEKEYFDDSTVGIIFTAIKQYIRDNENVPKSIDVVLSLFSQANSEYINIEKMLNDINNLDLDLVENYEYLKTETEKFLQLKAVQQAILNSVDVVEGRSNLEKTRELITEALLKTTKADHRISLYKTLSDDLDRIANIEENRIKTYLPKFDELLGGGLLPKTLTVIMAGIHGWKSQFMVNCLFRQSLNKKNVIVFTLEMGEDEYKKRIWSLMADVDVNLLSKPNGRDIIVPKLVAFKQSHPDLGETIIHELQAKSTLDMKKCLKDYELRGIKFDTVYVDYLNLMKPSYKQKNDLYGDLKLVTEELRDMAVEFNVPIISATQLNREGQKKEVKLEHLGYTYISESLGIGMTTDVLIVFGKDMEDEQRYQQQRMYKILKNRLGGRVNEVDTFYTDLISLKMWDSVEEEDWLNAAGLTGDTREILTNGN